jgi:hypothetical protein
MNPIAPIRIAGISGSLRRASFSTALIKLLARHLQPAIELSLVDIRDVPLYNEDLDGDNKPAAVHAVNAAIVIPGPEVVVGGVHTKFQDEVFLDQPTLDFMLSSLDRLRSEVVLRNAANAALQAAAR